MLRSGLPVFLFSPWIEKFSWESRDQQAFISFFLLQMWLPTKLQSKWSWYSVTSISFYSLPHALFHFPYYSFSPPCKQPLYYHAPFSFIKDKSWTRTLYQSFTAWYMWSKYFSLIIVMSLDSKKIKPVNPKVNQPWILIGRTDAEAEALIHWPHDGKSQPIGKDPGIGKDWGQKEKGVTEDEMVGCHHRLNAHEFVQIPGDSKGQGSLMCCSPWGHKELDTTEWLNNNSNKNHDVHHPSLLKSVSDIRIKRVI